jgi:FAD/FMN-containing dehydrogenase
LLRWRHDTLAPAGPCSMLPFGNGRSYGDSCLNDGGLLLDSRGLNRFISFDAKRGVIRCEAGVLLSDILELVVPRGWFLPVSPGTKYVTLGGAIANDVHGKNHHCAGSFGCHVAEFELLRSDGSRLQCSKHENAGWYQATIGGLGLTGLILWAELALQRVNGAAMDIETMRFRDLGEFFRLTAESDARFGYTVAWVDCAARGRNLGRGIFTRANHSRDGAQPVRAPGSGPAIPVDCPGVLLSDAVVRAFNACYYHKPRRRLQSVHYDSFLYPLDRIRNWNRIYGRRGFFQYQCVVGSAAGRDAVKELLARITDARGSSFLAVLKVFGPIRSPGLLSFPRPGVTLALDFPNRGAHTMALLDRLDEIVRGSGGAVYPAKDARMSAQSFRHYFPEWRSFSAYLDPRFSSNFWRRVAS